VYLRLRKLESAKQDLESALKINPNRTSARYSLATTLLNLGEEQRGWDLYESRLNLKRAKITKTPSPRWEGENLHGKSIFVLAEQGYGDMIQFVRFVFPLLHMRAKVFVECPEPLRRLFMTIAGVEVVPMRTSIKADYQIPIMSLPRILRPWEKKWNIPKSYFTIDEATKVRWRSRISGLRYNAACQIGIAWAGASRENHPHAQRLDKRRSLSIDQLTNLINKTDDIFHSLQNDSIEAFLKREELTLGSKIEINEKLFDHSTKLTDFYETAALIENLDRVVSVDTAVVHLAGALNKSTILLNRFDYCWRWGQIDNVRRWYKSINKLQRA
jgi:tetratricopeptide (TPR) repeat protein